MLFTAAQQERLKELMTRWRTARDSGGELDLLVQHELRAAADRSTAVLPEFEG